MGDYQKPDYNLPPLSDKQVKKILKMYAEGDGKIDIITITRAVFNKENLDGRSNEGKAVRKCLADHGFKALTSRDYIPVPDFVLRPDDEDFVTQNCFKMSVLQMTKALFETERSKIGTMSSEYKAVQAFAKGINPVGVADTEASASEYKPPSTTLQAIRCVRRMAHIDLPEDLTNPQHKAGIESLLKHTRAPRFLQTMKTYAVSNERDLFEAEFVRSTWDKPDLTSEELNLYVILCEEQVNIVRNDRIVAKLVAQLDNITDEEDKKISMSLSETIKSFQENRHKLVDRISKLSGDLIGKRKDRADARIKNSKSMVALVERVQNQDGRADMARRAALQVDIIDAEIKRFTEMDELDAKIFGLNQEDLLR